jgi:hypothetical protein
MTKIKDYRNYFEMIDERTPFSLFKKYVLDMIELAEEQQKELEKRQFDKIQTGGVLPSLKGRGTSPWNKLKKK